jgi:hypothetical protein
METPHNVARYLQHGFYLFSGDWTLKRKSYSDSLCAFIDNYPYYLIIE